MINLLKVILFICTRILVFVICVCFNSLLLHAETAQRFLARMLEEHIEKARVEYTDRKEIDISKSYSGSFDLNFDDNFSSSSIEDFFDYSKIFYQSPEDLLLKKGIYDENVLIRHLLHIYKKSKWNESISRLTDKKFPMYYKEIRSFLNDLLVRHYKDLDINHNSSSHPKNVYVFIGTSPLSSVLSFIEALKIKSDVISNSSVFRKSLDNSIFIDIPYDISKFNKLSDIKDVDVYEYFARYIDPSILTGNNVIVVDFVRSGMNAGSFIRNLKRYMLYSRVKEASFSADLFTFYPPNLYNSFLKKLSMYEFINIIYKDNYWNFLMKNLYLSGYDDAHRYYDSLLDRYHHLQNEEVIYAYENSDFAFSKNGFFVNDDKIRFLDLYLNLIFRGKKIDLNFLEGNRVYNSIDIYNEIWETNFWYRVYHVSERSEYRIYSYEDYKREKNISSIKIALLGAICPESPYAPYRLGKLPSKKGPTIPYDVDTSILDNNEFSTYSKYESDWIFSFKSEGKALVKKEFQELISKNEELIENDNFFRYLGSFCSYFFIR